MKFPNQRNENVSELLKMAQSQQRFGETSVTESEKNSKVTLTLLSLHSKTPSFFLLPGKAAS
jgi:hypothetical protein